MIATSTIFDQIKVIETFETHEERLQQTLKIFMKIFPVKEVLLFRYSHFGYLAEGVLALQGTEFRNISSIRDDVRSIPGILSSLRKREAAYYEGADYFKNMETKYVYSHHSGIVVPVTVHTLIIGYFISNELKMDQPMDDHTLAALTFFGKSVGQALCQLHSDHREDQALSRRKIQVIQKIANGKSTKEIASALKLSEVTISQYVKTAIKKLDAKNRTEAAVKLLRAGVIM